MILGDYLARNASLYPDKPALVAGGESFSYSQLQGRVDKRAEELRRSVASSSSRIVCLRALPSVEYIVDYFAYQRIGFAVAPLAKDIPEEVFEAISAELSSHTVAEGTAEVLYTTGTTGKSKGVIISHRTIIADAENLIHGQGFSHELAFVINGPLNHIGSLSKMYPVIMLGATMIIVDGLKDLDSFFGAFSYPAEKMATFLVPASIRILLQFCPERLAALADKIDFIETGAAAISQSDMEALCRLLPKSRLYNTYASTETGIVCTVDFNGGKCKAGCLGRPMPNSEIFITDKGTIACKGKTLMTGYLGDPQRTSSILRDGVLYTSDSGYIDEDGMLNLKGREDDVINVGGFKVSPLEVEDAAMSFEGVSDCICIPVPHPITGAAPKLLVSVKDGTEVDFRSLGRYLMTRLERHKVPLFYEKVDSVKRTFNGKPDRKFYLETHKTDIKTSK